MLKKKDLTEMTRLLKQRRGTQTNQKAKGFLTERKLSQEELRERDEWIARTRSRLGVVDDDGHEFSVRQVRVDADLFGLFFIKYAPNGETIVTTFGSGCIQFRNSDTGELKATLRCGLETALPVTSCQFHPTDHDTMYAASACGNIFTCKLDTVEFFKFAEEPENEICTIDINLAGDVLASGGKDAGIRLYDPYYNKLLLTYKKDLLDVTSERVAKYHFMKVFSVKFNRTYPSMLLSGGWDATLRVWDIRVKTGCVRTIVGPQICGDALDVRELKVLTGSWVEKNSLQLWDLGSGKLIETINPTNREPTNTGEYLYISKFFHGDPYGEHAIVGGSGLNCFEIVNLKTKRIVGSFNVSKPVVTADSLESNIAFGGMEPVVNLAKYN